MAITVVLICGGAVSVSRIVLGFPSMFVDNWVVLSLKNPFLFN